MSDESAIGVKVDEDFKREVRIAAAKQNMSMSEFVRESVTAALAELEQGNPNRATATASS